MFDPPSGVDDLACDVEDSIESSPRYRELIVDRLDGYIVSARRPSPRACHAISMAANSKIGTERQADHLTLFIRHHLTDESYVGIMAAMVEGTLPADALTEVARALATWGTARPTLR